MSAALAIALALSLWHLDREGFGNPYYAAAVRSMAQSWHNFYYVSFDPGGFISIDKPPVAFWIQTIVVRLFGFRPLTLAAPSAVAGAATVAVVYAMVRRPFGTPAASVAAVALAVTPISVATSRSNNPDAILALTVTVAAWALLRAVDGRSWRWLLTCALAVGIGFNAKFVAAFFILPALWIAFLVAGPGKWRLRVGQLAVATAVVFVVSSAWAMSVDATAPSSRPYVEGSTNNSELNLVLGHAGFDKFFGTRTSAPHASAESRGARRVVLQSRVLVPISYRVRKGAAPSRYRDHGRRGLLRLLDLPEGGQAGWLLPLGIVGLAAGLYRISRRRATMELAAWIVWGGWFVVSAAAFSGVAGVVHAYYLSGSAPAEAALVGAGVVTLWRHFDARRRAGILLPIGLVTTGLLQWHLLRGDPYFRWLAAVVLTVTAGIALALTLMAFRRQRRRIEFRRIGIALTAIAAINVFVAPVAFALTVPRNPGFGKGSPIAGPPLLYRASQAQVATQSNQSADMLGGSGVSALITFLRANRHGERWVLATSKDVDAQDIIIRSGLPVAALGGYFGSAPAITVAQTAELVASKQLRFVLVPKSRGHTSAAARADDWVVRNCRLLLRSSMSLKTFAALLTSRNASLYDCQPTRALITPKG